MKTSATSRWPGERGVKADAQVLGRLNGGRVTLAEKLTLQTRHGQIVLMQSSGTKLPIIFLHGGALCKELFRKQMDSPLANQHRMIALDFPGHGESSDARDPARSYTIEGLADSVLESLEQLDIDAAVVVGVGTGGRVGFELTKIFPGALGLVLASVPLPNIVGASVIELPEFGLLGDRNPETIATFLRRSLGSIEYDRFVDAALRADKLALDTLFRDIRSGFNSWPTAADLEALPVLAIDGGDRPYSSAAGQLPRAQYLIAQSGPAPFLEAPELFNHILGRFMQRMLRRERDLCASPSLWYGG